MNTLRQIYELLLFSAKKSYEQMEAEAIARLLTEYLCACGHSDLALDGGREVTLEAGRLDRVIKQLEQSRPVQYITAEAYLGDLKFYVDENVLIPRPETEELVRWICSDYRGERPKVLDIGTGSGCIAIYLAKYISASDVDAMDVSQAAISVAMRNAAANKVAIKFIEQDILTSKIVDRYNIIVSNPPYVLDSERQAMRTNVLDYEPAIALFVSDQQPLLFYERIARCATVSLNSGGRLYFEINEHYGTEVKDMLEQLGFDDVQLRKDIFDRDRMVRATWNRG